jgi:hypothetical protein
MLSDEMLEPPEIYASEPTAATTQTRGWWDAYIKSDALSEADVVTKRIWSVTRMDIAELSKGVRGGIPGLVNVYTGTDSLERLQEKISALQDELVWNTKDHYEH